MNSPFYYHCPAVSVVIPFHGHAPWLPHALNSVIAQTCQSWEALVVADNALDDVINWLEDLQQVDSRIRVLIPPSRIGGPSGPWYPRNYALDHAKGDYIAFLDSDDVWHPDKLACQLDLAIKSKAPLVITAYYRFRSSDLLVLETRYPDSAIRASQLSCCNPIPLSSSFVSAAIVDRHRFRPLFHEDYDFWLQLYDANPELVARACTDVLTAYRLHPDSLSASKIRGIVAVFRIYTNYYSSFTICMLRTICWLVSQLLKYLFYYLQAIRVVPFVLPDEFALSDSLQKLSMSCEDCL